MIFMWALAAQVAGVPWRRSWSLCAHHSQRAPLPIPSHKCPGERAPASHWQRPDCLLIYKTTPSRRVVGTIGWDRVFRAAGTEASSVTSLLRNQQTPGVCRDCSSTTKCSHYFEHGNPFHPSLLSNRECHSSSLYCPSLGTAFKVGSLKSPPPQMTWASTTEELQVIYGLST